MIEPGTGAGGRVRSAKSFMSFRPVSMPTGLAPGAAQFDAVVLGRVVAGRDHRARDAEVAAAEVEHVGRAEARGQHVGALARRAPAERGGERGRGGAHVVDGQDRRGPGQLGERRADRLGHALVKLVRDDAPDVIGLDDAREITHCRTRLPFAASPGWALPREPIRLAGGPSAALGGGRGGRLRRPGRRAPCRRLCRRWGWVSITALASASRSSARSWAGSMGSRTTSQPRGAVSRPACFSHRS